MKNLLIIGSIVIITVLLIGATGCNIKKQNANTDGGVFVSTDFGQNWSQKVFISQEKEGVRTISSVGTQQIYFDPIDDSIVYILTENNGIYRSENKGDQWKQTALSSGKYLDISIDNRNDDVIYVTQGTKILKSVDGSETWHDIYVETRPNQKLVSVQVSPFHSNIVYAASTSGMIRSTDYGNTWQVLEWGNATIQQLVASAAHSDTLYALASTGIYKTTDNASTWVPITESLKEYPGATRILWMNVDRHNEHIILGTGYRIFPSTDAGISWDIIPTLYDFSTVPVVTVIDHPDNLNEVLFAVKNVLLKTTDGGRTWKTLKTVATSRTINYLISDPTIPDTVYLGTKAPAQQ